MKIKEEVQVFTTTEEDVKLFAKEEELKTILDSSSHLREWNYCGRSCCDRCGISNSELEGLLIQCAKCKKAYYCSMACFNEDLQQHQEFCDTSKLLRQPEPGLSFFRDLHSSTSTTFSFEMAFTEEALVEKVEDQDPVVPESETHDDADTEVTETSEDDDLTSIAEVEYHNDEDELLYSRRGQIKLNAEKETINSGQRYHAGGGVIPENPRWEAETVALEPAETIRREYTWDTPEWVLHSPLKCTELGKAVKERGDLIAIKMESKLLPHFEPEWVKKSPLRRLQKIDASCQR